MTSLTVTKSYSANSVLRESHLDDMRTSIQNVVNGSLDTTSNIDFGGSIKFSLAANDSWDWNDSTDTLSLTVDGTKVLDFVEAATSLTIKTLVSNADMIFDVNKGGTNTTGMTIDGATANVQIHVLLADKNANEIIDIGATASAVNHIKVTNAATANNPKIEAAGDDTNISLVLDAKGSGIVLANRGAAPKVVALTDGATVATDASLGNVFTLTTTQNFTLSNPTNPTNGQAAIWIITQDATGSRTLTLGTAFRKSSGIVTTLSTGANAVDYMGAVYNGAASKWDIVMFETNVA